MGVVWRARDQLLDREVAIKEVVISALISADERRNAYRRTLREARTAARLSHRGVVTVYDVVEEDGRPWIVMELVPSQSLDQVLAVEGRLPPMRAGRIGQQLLSALAAAHAAGVLHRDVKPSNVLISPSRSGDGWEERAVLTDFGIAQFEGDPRLTQTGMVMGSPGFTAPERIRGGDATPGSDLWSLGATIYAGLEGRGPYENRGGAITTMSAIINEDAPVAPHAGGLAPVIAALLRRDPARRPSAAAAMRMFAQAMPQLSEATEEPPPLAHPPTIRSAYVPVPAAPVASAPATSPDDARRAEKPAPAVEEEPAEETPAAEAPAEEETAKGAPESPSADEADEAASGVSADSAGEADSAALGSEAGLEDEAGSDADDDAESEPESESGPAAEAEPDAEDTAERAAETTRVKIPVPEAAEVPVPEAAPADAGAAAAEPKAAAALLEERPEEEEGSQSAETVIPGKKTAGYQPTQLSVPVARIAPSAPVKPPSTAQPPPVSPKPAPAKPAPPKPTFTAAKPTERAAPTFSAASPGRPAPPVRPATPQPDQRSAYGAGSAGQGYGAGSAGQGAGQGYPPPRQPGSTPPYPPSGAHYGPAGGLYAGPAQSTFDLGRQYPLGTGGGRTGRAPAARGRQVIWLVVAVIIAAAIGVGVALALSGNGGSNNGAGASSTSVPSVADTPTGFQSVDALNNPSTALPAANWSTKTVTAADAQSSAAGFSIDVPNGWTETRKGLATDFSGPGGQLVEVDLTQQPTANMLDAATQVEAGTHFPAYQRQNLQAEPVRNAEGAVWKFDWTPAGGVNLTADDIFFPQSTSAGVQDYAIYVRSPTSTFSSSLTVFDEMLRTFQTVP